MRPTLIVISSKFSSLTSASEHLTKQMHLKFTGYYSYNTILGRKKFGRTKKLSDFITRQRIEQLMISI